MDNEIKTVILEGANGCGKSTTAKLLSDILDLSVQHSGPRPMSVEEGRIRSAEEVENRSPCVIYDRCNCISRLVYHDDLPLSAMRQYFLDLEKTLENSVIIHCVGTGIIQHKDYYTDEHKKLITDDSELIKARYIDLMSEIDHIEYDFQKMTVDDLVDKVISAW